MFPQAVAYNPSSDLPTYTVEHSDVVSASSKFHFVEGIWKGVWYYFPLTAVIFAGMMNLVFVEDG